MTVIGITEQSDGPHRKDVIAVHGTASIGGEGDAPGVGTKKRRRRDLN